MAKKEITPKSKDFSQWYLDVVQKAELADYAPVRGCIVFRPYGFAIWERIKAELDAKIKGMGVPNAYFPLFIPESFLNKEKEHVEGFSPELAVVTVGGGKELEEPLVIRPTSETIIYPMFAKWIQSWRDLPMKVNQWANMVRWEKRTYPFLRTMEFLWQEGHTAHATHQEALEQVHQAAKVYEKVFCDYLGVYGIPGYKSESEKFAGSVASVSYEALMPDGKALQSSTSHDLGQNFSRAFEIKFQNEKGKEDFAWQTCWGFSTRALGGMLMVHGDDDGLILPPLIAPVQAIIVPIWKESAEKSRVLDFAEKVKAELDDFRVEIDDREQYTPGWKFNHWELKGVPLRLEVGAEEVESEEITVVRRDGGKNVKCQMSNVKAEISELLHEIQNNLYLRSKDFTEKNTHTVDDYGEFKEIMENERGFIKAFWCESPDCEAKIKEETKATTRCLPLADEEEEGKPADSAGKCIYCGKPAKRRWLFAQAY